MSELSRQATFLSSLSSLEKAQLPDRLVCSAITFVRDAAAIHIVSDHGDFHVDVALETGPHEAFLALAPYIHEPFVDPSQDVQDVYPLEMSTASVWAEMHYDLSRVAYLEAIDDSIRYETISLRGDHTLVALSKFDHGRSMRVTADVLLPMNLFPVHVADELGAAIVAI